MSSTFAQSISLGAFRLYISPFGALQRRNPYRFKHTESLVQASHMFADPQLLQHLGLQNIPKKFWSSIAMDKFSPLLEQSRAGAHHLGTERHPALNSI